jgi:hypothetical protein
MRHSVTALVAGATLLLGACGVECTLLPCPGLTVQLQGVVPSDYTVTLSSPGANPVSRSCGAATPCLGNQISFAGRAPDTATVSVVWAGNSVAVTVQPSYETVYPNGTRCNACRAATITITLG